MAISLGPSGLQLNDGTHNDYADFAGGGKVLQVAQYTFTNQGTQTSSTSFQSSFMTGNITPSSTSSKILITATAQVLVDAYSNQGINNEIGIFRNGSEVFRFGYNSWTDSVRGNCCLNYLDSPSSTSAVTYNIRIRNHSTYGGSRLTGWVCNGGSSSCGATLILTEIGT
jgi:hypothetical protein